MIRSHLSSCVLAAAIVAAGCSASPFASSRSMTMVDHSFTMRSSRAGLPRVGGCQVFPKDNPWNTDISQYPKDPRSATYLAHMNAGSTFLHPDFGSNLTYGIPFVVVSAKQPYVPMEFIAYPKESDPGPYPFPKNAPIEGGPHSNGDRHVLVIDRGNCHLYETFRSFYTGPGWTADNGAKFDFASNTATRRLDVG